ncbi:MAG: hypothetical protein ACOCTH_01980, partial [Halodesulfurarchaeum sp.]
FVLLQPELLKDLHRLLRVFSRIHVSNPYVPVSNPYVPVSNPYVKIALSVGVTSILSTGWHMCCHSFRNSAVRKYATTPVQDDINPISRIDNSVVIYAVTIHHDPVSPRL